MKFSKCLLIVMLLISFKCKSQNTDQSFKCTNAFGDRSGIESSNHKIYFELLLLKDGTYVFSLACGYTSSSEYVDIDNSIQICFSSGEYIASKSMIQLKDIDRKKEFIFKILNDSTLVPTKCYSEFKKLKFVRNYFNFDNYYFVYSYDRHYKRRIAENKMDTSKIVVPVKVFYPTDSLVSKYICTPWWRDIRYILSLNKDKSFQIYLAGKLISKGKWSLQYGQIELIDADCTYKYYAYVQVDQRLFFINFPFLISSNIEEHLFEKMK
jgi:hypothetical protein